MRLSSKAIADFKRIYKEEFGEDLTDDKAEECAFQLLSLFDLLFRPSPEDIHSPRNRVLTGSPKSNYHEK